MRVASLIRWALYGVVLYGLLWQLPNQASSICVRSEWQQSAPCLLYTKLESQTSNYIGPYYEHLGGYFDRVGLTEKYTKLTTECLPKSVDFLSYSGDVAKDFFDKKVRPSLIKLAGLTKTYGRVAWKASERQSIRALKYTRKAAVPVARQYLVIARDRTIELFWKTWKGIESSQLYNDVIRAQIKKIVDKVEAGDEAEGRQSSRQDIQQSKPANDHALDSTFSSLDSTAEMMAEPTPDTLFDSTAEILAAPTPVENVETDFSANTAEEATLGTASETKTEDDSKLSATSASTTLLRTPSSSPSGESSAAASVKSTTSSLGKAWTKRIERTVDGALSHMQGDADDAIEREITNAKPEIMELLRDIKRYGDKALDDVRPIAEDLEREESNLTPDEVYGKFETHSRELAEMALRVRGRAEELAHAGLKSLTTVRQVTLDALDDYFDIVLAEAGHEITASDDEWADWKWYHALKNRLRELRSSVESHEFAMEKMNTALRESQAASIVLVQEFNQELSNLRARCQLVYQELSDGVTARDEKTQDEDGRPADDNERAYSRVYYGDEESANTEKSPDAGDPGTSVNVQPERDDVESSPEDSPLSTNDDVDSTDASFEFEDSEEIDTVWETRVTTVTVQT